MRRIIKYIVNIKWVKKLLISCFRIDIWRKWRIRKYLKNADEPKLQIGCGSNPLNGWLNTDISLKCRYGVYLDAGKTFPMSNASFNYVFSEHLFEHLTYPQAMNMLKESYRILKPGGVIRIATPDLHFLMGLYQEPEKPINKQYIEYSAKRGGIPPTPVFMINRFHTAWGHKIIYDNETLKALLEQVGFKDVCNCEVGQSIHPALRGVEGHTNSLPDEFNRLETMVLEARK